MRSVAVAWLTLLPFVFNTPASGAHEWEVYQGRLKREAIGLFSTVLADRNTGFDKCELSTEWLDYAVPSSIARESLRTTVHADLSPPHHATDPQEVLDPSRAMRDRFCDKETFERLRKSLADLLNAEPSIDTTHGKIEYSFPIFDKNFRTAVFVRSSFYGWFYKKPESPVRPRLETATWAEVYRKIRGKWRRQKPVFLAAGHG